MAAALVTAFRFPAAGTTRLAVFGRRVLTPAQAAKVSVARPAGHGAAVVEADGRVAFTPEPDFSGEDGFVLNVADLADVPGTLVPIVLVIDAVPPVLADAGLSVRAGEEVAFDPARGATVGTHALALASAAFRAQPAHGAAYQNDAGLIVYVPAEGFAGRDGFAYTMADVRGTRSNAAVVGVTVRPLA